MVRRLLKHALTCNETHTYNRKGTENRSATEAAHSRAHSAYTQHCQHVCGTWGSLKLKLTHTHTHMHMQAHMLRLANWQINVAIMLAQQKLLNIIRLSSSSSWKTMQIQKENTGKFTHLWISWAQTSKLFIIYCLSVFALSLFSHCPFSFLFASLSKYVKAKLIDAKRFQDS